jgi:hypothetical protein
MYCNKALEKLKENKNEGSQIVMGGSFCNDNAFYLIEDDFLNGFSHFNFGWLSNEKWTNNLRALKSGVEMTISNKDKTNKKLLSLLKSDGWIFKSDYTEKIGGYLSELENNFSVFP